MAMTLLVGGARSGKSRLAVALAVRSCRPVVVIATGEARDDEMVERIERHRVERPVEWETIEEPIDMRNALDNVPDGSFVIVDCLTLWVSNLIERGASDTDVATHARDAAARAATLDVVAVTNDVGSGIVPGHALARRFRDVLGTVNAIWAAAASRAVYVVAGRVTELEHPEAIFDG